MDNTYFVSSDGLSGNGKDSYHFSSASYEEFGKRYADEMLKHIKLGPVVLVPRTPYGENVVNIPGKIEAENFDVPGTGAANKTYNDADSENRGKSTYRADDASSADLYYKATGVILGYNQEGEWFEYSVNVAETGDYTMFASVATDNSTSGFSLSIDGGTIAEVPTSGTSFDSYNFVQANVTLPEGEHILRMTVTGSWFDVDYFTFVKGKDATDPEAYKTQEPESFTALKLVNNAETTFFLFDLQGKQVARFNARGMDSAIHMVQEGMGNLRQGVYLLRHKGPAGIQQNIVYKK
ncbi:MAG: carbohydrate-binding protein [Fibrobacter sp.]|nr:carbohydrate-binding protein [Fibrobacter sp.]